MTKFIITVSLVLASFCSEAQTVWGNSNSRTETRDNAGLQGNAGALSGFFETSYPINYPSAATGWWHLLDIRHSNTANNFSMQFSGSFFDQQLWFRKTNNNPSQSWSRVLMETDGKVGIGTTSPGHALDVRGNIYTNSSVIVDGGDLILKRTTTPFGYVVRPNVAGYKKLQFAVEGGGPLENLYVNSDQSFFTGNVGIGTATPNARLHVNGRMRIEDDADNGNIGGALTLTHPGKTASGAARDWVIYNMSGIYGNSLQFWAYDNTGCGSGGLCSSRFTIMDNGNVGIGTNAPQAKLAVNGDIFSKKIKITQTGWPDYVFESNYKLPTLLEVEQYIQQHKHLPGVLSAAEVEKDGLDLGDNQAAILKKVEELTLYIIEQNKKVDELTNKVSQLKKENDELKEQVTEIKKQLKK